MHEYKYQVIKFNVQGSKFRKIALGGFAIKIKKLEPLGRRDV
jgi:hypothetical protein